MTERQLRQRKRRDLLHWGTFALFLLSNILNISLQQHWTFWLFVACTLIWIVTMLVTIEIEHRALVQRVKVWRRQDELFLATLENMQTVAESDMDIEDKQQALHYLHQQWQSREGA